MNIKNIIKSTLVSVAILSVPALSTSAQAAYDVSPGTSCKAYYPGNQNKIGYYSGRGYAVSFLRVICSLGQLKNHMDGNRELVNFFGYNVSGKSPVCHVVETGQRGYSRWTRMPVFSSTPYHYFQSQVFVTKRRSTNALSISCVLSKGDYISKLDAIER